MRMDRKTRPDHDMNQNPGRETGRDLEDDEVQEIMACRGLIKNIVSGADD